MTVNLSNTFKFHSPENVSYRATFRGNQFEALKHNNDSLVLSFRGEEGEQKEEAETAEPKGDSNTDGNNSNNINIEELETIVGAMKAANSENPENQKKKKKKKKVVETVTEGVKRVTEAGANLIKGTAKFSEKVVDLAKSTTPNAASASS